MGKRTLDTAVRGMNNLYRSFTIVRSNVYASGRAEFKLEVQKISENPIPYLRRIQTDLKKSQFKFEQQKGITKKKSGGKVRPIVVSPIRNRVVQRAILNVLQSENSWITTLLGEIPAALRTATSVGGIPDRGVSCGINLVSQSIKGEAKYYLRSDIRDFFTKIPKLQVIEFVGEQTNEEKFSNLFGRAMGTELENANEIKEWLHLFPLDDVGVPQGSSLSAFAGNVILRRFDKELNERGITTVRYIDDFVILGKSERVVRSAFSSASLILNGFGMKVYDPDDDSDKSKIGRISDGFEFLGCSIQTNGVAPSRNSTQNLLSNLESTLATGIKEMNGFISSGEARRAEEAYAQVLVRADRIIRGWGDAFSFANSRLRFSQIDEKIDELLRSFRGRARRIFERADGNVVKRRAFGIALLRDTPYSPMPVHAQETDEN